MQTYRVWLLGSILVLALAAPGCSSSAGDELGKTAPPTVEAPVSSGTEVQAAPAPANHGQTPAQPGTVLAPKSNTVPAESGTAAGNPIICIDPGHPSETSSGARDNGLSENQLNWRVAVRLKACLTKMKINSIMTKQSENQYVTNRRRAEIANDAKAVLFVRIHCDDGGGSGYTWYYPDRSATKEGVTGPPSDVQRASHDAAEILNTTMAPLLKANLRRNPVKTDAATFVGGKQGGVLTGSVFSRVPTALLEMCFINKRTDARFIASPEGQQKMAEAIAAGIRSYLDSRDDAKF